jgi:iron(III) transport system permease protein
MGWLRGLGRVLGGFLLVALLIPSVAAWPSSMIDRGADGEPRISIFPLALTLFDPFVWTCARNSTTAAILVSAGSLVLGLGLALVAGRWRFRGRAPLWALAMVPIAAGPLLIAPGIVLALGGSKGWEWLAARSILGYSCELAVRWLALVWVGLASGVPLVALTTASALRGVESSWSEAARAMGASRWRIWLEIVWPNLRPRVSRALAMVFTLTLVEPVGPLFLGLRRTLATQILDSAIRLDQPTRAATLALLATAFAVAGQALIGWWGGRIDDRSPSDDGRSASSAGSRRAWLSRLILVGWSFFAVGPIVLLLNQGWRAGQTAVPGHWFSRVLGWLSDPQARTWAWNSATTAGLALTIDLVLLGVLLRCATGSSREIVRLAGRLIESIPPLALGVGALSTPWILAALADHVGGRAGQALRSVALELSPGRSPGFLLLLALAAGNLPMLARATELARGLIVQVRIDAARLMGVTDRLATRAGDRAWLGVVPVVPSLLALALALTNLTPALLLTPFSERRTVATAALEIALERNPFFAEAFGPMAAILTVNLLAFALAWRCRIGGLGDWFRGR